MGRPVAALAEDADLTFLLVDVDANIVDGDRGLLPLPEAIRKMTSLPAAKLGLRDRGRLAPGAAADVVVFDPATVADTATFAEPHRHPRGIPWVLVNGQPVVTAGRHTGRRPGRVLGR